MYITYPQNATKRLKQILKKAQTHPFYQERLSQVELTSKQSLAELLPQIPPTTRQDLYNFQNTNPKLPYQPAYIFKNRADNAGNDIYFPFSQTDFQSMIAVEENNFTHLGLKPGDVVSIIDFSHQHIPTISQGLINIGCTYVPVTGDTTNIIDQIKRHSITHLYTNVHTINNIIDHLKSTNDTLKLDHVMTIGEKIQDRDRFRQKIRDIFGAKHTDLIGTSELCIYASENPRNTQYHFRTDNFIFEIVDPKTLKPSPEGEILITSLWHQDLPFIRYRTHDYIKLTDSSSFYFNGIEKRLGQLIKINATLISLNELTETIEYALLYQKPTDKILWKLFTKPQIFTLVRGRYNQDQVHIFIEHTQFRKSKRRKIFIEKAVYNACGLKPFIHLIPQNLIPQDKLYRYHDQRNYRPSRQVKQLLDRI